MCIVQALVVLDQEWLTRRLSLKEGTEGGGFTVIDVLGVGKLMLVVIFHSLCGVDFLIFSFFFLFRDGRVYHIRLSGERYLVSLSHLTLLQRLII